MLRKLLFLLFLLPSAAQAEWRKAESKHFIVYSGGTAEDLQRRILKLERFHRLLRTVSGVKKPELASKPRIFLLADMFEVQKSLGGAPGVLGYYEASPRGSILVGSNKGQGGERDLDGEAVLLHEYTHHFMLDYFPAVYPSWFTEGFAEYFGRTRIGDDDQVEIGLPANARYESMRYWVPTRKLLTAKTLADIDGAVYSLYGQGWLTVHYLTHNKERQGQLETYLNAINAGESYASAMEKAFGKNATKLDSELVAYSHKSKIPTTILPFKPLDLPPIEMRVLSAAEEALIPYEIMLSRGLRVSEAKEFAEKVRSITARFPNDGYALSMLVEAELAVGDKPAATTALNRWLAVEPDAPRALMHKANLRLDELRTSGSKDEAAWKSARQMLVRAVNRAPNDPMLLEAYYDSFAVAGAEPSAAAHNALFTAHEIVPNYTPFRYKLASDFERMGMISDAINTIRPAALELDEGETDREKRRREKLELKYRTVGEEKRETPLEMLTRLEAKLANSSATARAQ